MVAERLANPRLLLQEAEPSTAKYSANDRELLAIYESVKYFRHMLESRHFTIMPDRKTLSFATQ